MAQVYTFREVQIPVPFGVIRGKWYGPTNVRPILFLHGYNDNSGSYDRLLPLLPTAGSYLAIDLPGHGLSSWMPSGTVYHLTDATICIRRIMKTYGWSQVSLVGHSLGAMMCYIFIGLYPDKVDLFVALDALQPSYPGEFYKQLAFHFDRSIEYDDTKGKKPSGFTYDKMLSRVRYSAGTTIPKELCHHLLERNIRESSVLPGTFHYTFDSRTKYLDISGWSRETNLETARANKCPVLVIKATESFYYGDEDEFKRLLDEMGKNNPLTRLEAIEGNHYVHLIEAESVASVIGKFLIDCKRFDEIVVVLFQEPCNHWSNFFRFTEVHMM
ncbi:valacyclovir hydrolase [Culex quinquefasciatus]|uniref:Valacyclovir hydrolase n=1 Tax=Culex quinquefasciatus TaxID=7176 RepID=B0W294_CULQU|nr:valacyclovir hydrolase [Culex quinquefasciatus]|eukprot:XP_001842793.1 valacyclovir hydrolase [Culex quinquefasciatus]